MPGKPTNSILLFAFLRRQRHYDRKLYVVVIVCMAVQLLLTLIKAEATPFLLYGMFSEKQVVTDTITSVSIRINNKPLAFYNMALREQQLLETTAGNYVQMKDNNNTDLLRTKIESRYPLIYNAGIYPWLSHRIYNTGEDQLLFKSWLKQKCLNVANAKQALVHIVRTSYLLARPSLEPTVIRHEIVEVL
ncbi:MAG: hypothetical protein EOO02_02065 [Chitinophagaceae bacterium]|nr:MAG: hypothetical protein EOO02_02065 [Chitinophagaceae bacterium]